MHALEGKTALVTGAGGERGIGRAVALRLAKDGANVAVTDVAAKPYSEQANGWRGLESVVEQINGHSVRGLPIVADISKAADVDRMVDECLAAFGQIDILVNNAGAKAAGDRKAIVDLDEADWERVQRVNAQGTFLCCRAVARKMIDAGNGGRIINIASVAGKRGIAKFGAYCASKFAVIGLTQCLALELADDAITVNAVCPGLVGTERVSHMAAALKADGESVEAFQERFVEETETSIPLGRLAEPQDVANAVAFLASPDAKYLTGLSVPVAGGLLLN